MNILFIFAQRKETLRMKRFSESLPREYKNTYNIYI